MIGFSKKFVDLLIMALVMILTFSCSSDDPEPAPVTVSCQITGGACLPNFLVEQCIPIGTIVASCSAGNNSTVSCLIAGQCIANVYTAEQCVQVTGTVVSPCGGTPPDISVQSVLTVNVEPAGGGIVLVDAAPYTAPITRNSGTAVAVTAITNDNFEFIGWSGALSSTSEEVSITLDGNKNLTANFLQMKGTISDSRDGKIYNWVRIGTLAWMAKNLDYAGTNNNIGVCYGNNSNNCTTYGRLYNWAAVMDINASYNTSAWNGSSVGHKGICPEGWHIPGRSDWRALMFIDPKCNSTSVVCRDNVAGAALKAKSGWSSGAGTDEFGFSALPGGGRISAGGDFLSINEAGYWWTASDALGSDAWYYRMKYDEREAYEGSGPKVREFSVRCVQD
jgi:uncharacterized protein (TIGR02145 family)